jgi:hypothetical protein
MWPFRQTYDELSSALREIIWSDPNADPDRHCHLVAQLLYPNEELSLVTVLQPTGANRIIADCDTILRKGIILSNQLLIPFLNHGHLHILFQRADLLINPTIFINPQELLSINLSLIGGTSYAIETGIFIDVNPGMNYEGFMNLLLGHPLFQERFRNIYTRLFMQGYHLPRDIEVYYIPDNFKKEFVEVLSVLVDQGNSGASIGDALPVVHWAGNGQEINIGSLLAIGNYNFTLLVAPARRDTLIWADKQAYTNYKQNIKWYEHGYRGRCYSYSNMTKIGAFLIRAHYRDLSNH